MPARKRAASPRANEGRRRSGRVSSTPKKSMYFEDTEDSDVEEDDGFEAEPSSADDQGEDEDEDEEERLAKRARGRPPTKAKAAPAPKKAATKPKSGKLAKSEDLEDDYQDDGDAASDDDEEESEDDEDQPPKVTIIPLEQLRPLDGVEYADEKLHKNSLLFLKDLKANNIRSWLKSMSPPPRRIISSRLGRPSQVLTSPGHDGEYRRALQDWNIFVETFTPRVSAADFTIPELPAKDLTFRIHRDIRFSKDPTPYKPHFSAAWSRTGRKGPYACYYVHAEPGGRCFVGGGLWHPPGDQVRLLRQSIDERPARWRRVLNEPRFRKTFLEPKMKTKKGRKDPDLGMDDPEAAVLAFASSNQENALKKKPNVSRIF